MRTLQIILVYIFSVTSGSSQTPFSIDAFLAGVDEEKGVVYQRQQIDFMNTAGYDLPIVKKLQFRTELHDFDIRQQEYLLRASLNGFKKINAQSAYQSAILTRGEKELEVTRAWALRERYDLLIGYIYQQKILRVKNEQNALFRDKVLLLKRSVLLANFDVLDLIDAEDELHDNQQGILDIEQVVLSAEQLILYLGQLVEMTPIDTAQLLTIDGLKNWIQQETVLFMAINEHPQLDLLQAEKETNRLAYDLERSKSQFSINYIQAKYADNMEDSFRENFSIGLGFDIPLKNTDRLDLNELQLNIIASDNQYDYVEQQLLLGQNLKLVQLQHLIQKHELVQEQLMSNQAELVLEEYRKIADVSPVTLLTLRESTLKKELYLEKLHLEIMQTYIAYLDAVGVLSQRPIRNFLIN